MTVVALVTWLVLYASGLLLETVEYRAVLAPRAMQKMLPPGDPLLREPPPTGASLPVPPTGASATAAKQTVLPNHFVSFLAAFFFFTPNNLVLLTLAAAFLGGCLSNVVAASLEDHERAKVPSRRLAFLSEHPLAAMMRGFVIYLCVVAGLYVALDDPFKDTTPGQYARLAGTLSLVAFVVGYDPSRIESWLRLVPSPSPRGDNVEIEMRHEVTTQVTKQETVTASGPPPTLPPPSASSSPAAIPAPVAVGARGESDAALASDADEPHRPPQPR